MVDFRKMFYDYIKFSKNAWKIKIYDVKPLEQIIDEKGEEGAKYEIERGLHLIEAYGCEKYEKGLFCTHLCKGRKFIGYSRRSEPNRPFFSEEVSRSILDSMKEGWGYEEMQLKSSKRIVFWKEGKYFQREQAVEETKHTAEGKMRLFELGKDWCWENVG